MFLGIAQLLGHQPHAVMLRSDYDVFSARVTSTCESRKGGRECILRQLSSVGVEELEVCLAFEVHQEQGFALQIGWKSLLDRPGFDEFIYLLPVHSGDLSGMCPS